MIYIEMELFKGIRFGFTQNEEDWMEIKASKKQNPDEEKGLYRTGQIRI